MQRHLFFLMLCSLVSISVVAQTPNVLNADRVPVLRLPAQDNDALLAEELAARVPGRAPHYALPQSVDASPANDGIWVDHNNGTSSWKLRVQSPTAKSLSFGFTEYWMPRGGALYLYAGNQKDPRIMGPFTPADNEVHNELWTQVLTGDDIIIEVQLPTSEKSNLRLRLTTVLHDFLGFTSNSALSGSCNLDVVCTAADGWGIVDGYRDIIRSVAVYGTGGGTFCTGFLVNNAREDCTPYFMTANHCGVGAGNAPSLVVYWNFENSVCRQPGSPASGGAGDGSLAIFNSGATWRASNPATDMTIVELDDDVNPNANAFYAGWSREEAAPADTVIAIHHPSTDEKRITFTFQDSYRAAGLSPNADPNGTHIAIPDWDIGTTEPGSSGSPVYDKNRRVRGQLHGGAAACGNDAYDAYGYVHVSWEGGGTPSTRLKDWLDPDDTGLMFMDGKEQLSCQISVNADQPVQTLCDGDQLTYDLLVGGGFTSDVDLTINGLPAGANGAFSQNPVAPNTSVTLTVTYDGTVMGSNAFTIGATDGDVSSTTDLSFILEAAPPAAPAAISPADGSNDAPIVANLNWADVSADTYEYELADDAGFTNILASGTTESNNYIHPEVLDSNVEYFWRVRASNSCGFGPWSAAYSFTTAEVICAPALTNNDVEPIPDDGETVSVIDVDSEGSISFMTVDVNITHTYVGDLIISLISPEGEIVVLADRIGFPATGFGCFGDDLSLTFSDAAPNTAEDLENTCNDLPAASGEFQPVEPLANFNGDEQFGEWLLFVSDNAGQDVGSITSWSITFCGGGGDTDFSAAVTSDPISTCANGNGTVTIQLGSSWGNGVDASATVNGDELNGVTTTQNGSVLTVELGNLLTLTSGDYQVVITLTDETGATQNVTAPITIEPVPSIASQQSPDNGTAFTDPSITFSWAASTNVTDYTLQISEDETFASIDFSQTTTNTSLTTNVSLEGLLYWRVVANNDCGNATGSPFNFTLSPNSLHQFSGGRSLSIFPNPAQRQVFLDMQGNWTGELEVNLLTIRGRVMTSQRLGAGGRQALDISSLPAGTYLLDLRNGKERTVERLVILP